MGICYIGFTVQVHGLKIQTKDQVDELRQAIKTAVETVHPARDSSMLDGDVEVEITEYAGQIYEELPEPTEVESRCAIT
jgi:hypothetical protein